MQRFRWYYFYMLLAAFDALIIAGGWLLQHRSVAQFKALLDRTTHLDARQRELTELGRAVLSLNAPGNRVFENNELEKERRAFHYMLREINRQRETSRLAPDHIATFWRHVDAMVDAEGRIFRLIAGIQADADETPADAARLDEALAQMARMDRLQADALREVSALQETVLREAAENLADYDAVLEGQTRMEIGFGVALVAALVGMILYTRKLQRTDEAMRAERRHVENERRERLAMIGELCSGVAHGIQNPLATIRSSAELIGDLGEVDAESRQRAADVLAECDRLSRRVARLLDFARARTQSQQRINLLDAVIAVAHELESRINRARIDVTIRGTDDVWVRVSPEELDTIFIEVLSNALDHVEPGGRIDVIIDHGDGFGVATIHDNGPGVASKSANRVFDLFYSSRAGGTGVGLAWARRVAQAAGGELLLVDADAPGAVFELRLPLDVEPVG
jgi:signal transduction histidine kinase